MTPRAAHDSAASASAAGPPPRHARPHRVNVVFGLGQQGADLIRRQRGQLAAGNGANHLALPARSPWGGLRSESRPGEQKRTSCPPFRAARTFWNGVSSSNAVPAAAISSVASCAENGIDGHAESRTRNTNFSTRDPASRKAMVAAVWGGTSLALT